MRCIPVEAPSFLADQNAKYKGSRQRERIAPRIKVWLEIDGSYAFGRGISDILKAVDEAGSIKRAAAPGERVTAMSGSESRMPKTPASALVERHVGGKDAHRSHLTELARSLVKEFIASEPGWEPCSLRNFATVFRNLLD